MQRNFNGHYVDATSQQRHITLYFRHLRLTFSKRCNNVVLQHDQITTKWQRYNPLCRRRVFAGKPT